eukprot:1795075-Amphidinium_carterae.1
MRRVFQTDDRVCCECVFVVNTSGVECMMSGTGAMAGAIFGASQWALLSYYVHGWGARKEGLLHTPIGTLHNGYAAVNNLCCQSRNDWQV